MRFWEVDFARGIAIVLMVIFNWSYALRYFDIFTAHQSSWIYWYLFPRMIAAMFIFIMGLSLTLSYTKLKDKSLKYSKYLKRGLFIFSLGLLVSFVTLMMFPENFIRFGILHMIGFSIILAIPFLKLNKINLILGTAIMLLGFMLETFQLDFSWLFWFIPQHFATFDYFPILPWFGVVLLGIYFGRFLYRNNERAFKLPDFSKTIFVRCIGFLGRNSLIIYLLHQPLLILILIIFGFPLSL